MYFALQWYQQARPGYLQNNHESLFCQNRFGPILPLMIEYDI